MIRSSSASIIQNDLIRISYLKFVFWTNLSKTECSGLGQARSISVQIRPESTKHAILYDGHALKPTILRAGRWLHMRVGGWPRLCRPKVAP